MSAVRFNKFQVAKVSSGGMSPIMKWGLRFLLVLILLGIAYWIKKQFKKDDKVEGNKNPLTGK